MILIVTTQVGVVTTFSLLFLSFLLLSSSFKRNDDLTAVTRESLDVKLQPGVVSQSSKLVLSLYSCLPLASLSRGWGWLAATEFPQPLQFIILWVFSSATGCNR